MSEIIRFIPLAPITEPRVNNGLWVPLSSQVNIPDGLFRDEGLEVTLHYEQKNGQVIYKKAESEENLYKLSRYGIVGIVNPSVLGEEYETNYADVLHVEEFVVFCSSFSSNHIMNPVPYLYSEDLTDSQYHEELQREINHRVRLQSGKLELNRMGIVSGIVSPLCDRPITNPDYTDRTVGIFYFDGPTLVFRKQDTVITQTDSKPKKPSSPSAGETSSKASTIPEENRENSVLHGRASRRASKRPKSR